MSELHSAKNIKKRQSQVKLGSFTIQILLTHIHVAHKLRSVPTFGTSTLCLEKLHPEVFSCITLTKINQHDMNENFKQCSCDGHSLYFFLLRAVLMRTPLQSVTLINPNRVSTKRLD